jgi:hypothetical protein
MVVVASNIVLSLGTLLGGVGLTSAPLDDEPGFFSSPRSLVLCSLYTRKLANKEKNKD